MNWSRVAVVLAVLALGVLVVGAVASLLGGGTLDTRSGVLVIGIVGLTVLVLASAGLKGADIVKNPYW